LSEFSKDFLVSLPEHLTDWGTHVTQAMHIQGQTVSPCKKGDGTIEQWWKHYRDVRTGGQKHKWKKTNMEVIKVHKNIIEFSFIVSLQKNTHLAT